jgi:guanylate cyclase
MSVGAYPGETDAQAGVRRIVIGYIVFGIPPRLFFGAGTIAEGFTAVGMVDIMAAVVPAIALVVLGLRPHWFVGIVNVLLFAILAENLVATVMYGGLLEAGLLMAFGVLVVVGALIALDVKAAFWWFVAYLVSLYLAVVLPEWIDPIYDVEPAAAGDIAGTIGGATVFVFAGMAYFVRQRDRFQKESDDLLHNILPDEIAARLKTDPSMIADNFPHASVLFADVVGFTPMSAEMTPPQLVGLLNSVFTRFDEFVEELDLEKIKTIGDEYMVAAGVPSPRDDHAEAIAELALRIRDHVATHDFEGHRLELRIGIHSGPVVAGIIGTHKFSYDLWGDTVNTASRMESGGMPGQIQVTPETHALLDNNGYRFEPRGAVEVKGKGTMNTWLLTGRASSAEAAPPGA